MSKGFTLIELIVVISIIVLITALTLPNYRAGDKLLALQRATHKLSQDLRRAQEMAISAKEFEGEVSAYGIYLNEDQPTKYILFADIDGDQEYSGLNEQVEEITLETNIEIREFYPIHQSSLHIVFSPPDPSTTFSPDASSAVIEVAIEGSTIEAPQYVYNYFQTVLGWIDPELKADCDQNPQTEECPDSFPAELSDPIVVYDRFQHPSEGKRSKEFYKEATGGTGRIIHINRAGLIAIQ